MFKKLRLAFSAQSPIEVAEEALKKAKLGRLTAAHGSLQAAQELQYYSAMAKYQADREASLTAFLAQARGIEPTPEPTFALPPSELDTTLARAGANLRAVA